MKHYLILAVSLFALLTVASCKKENGSEPSNSTEATILKNKTYKGDYYVGDKKEDVITITFTKASNGTLEFKATLAKDAADKTYLVGTWKVDGDQLWLTVTATYGDTSDTNIASGPVTDGGNKFNITGLGNKAFKNMAKA